MAIPLLRLVGDYDVDARILVVPIKGTGTFKANASKYINYNNKCCTCTESEKKILIS